MKKAIFDTASLLGTRWNCIALGKELHIHKKAMAHVESKHDSQYTPSDAYTMLNGWLLSKPEEPDKALYSALKEIGRADVAEEIRCF